jgi:hypothetical protein
LWKLKEIVPLIVKDEGNLRIYKLRRKIEATTTTTTTTTVDSKGTIWSYGQCSPPSYKSYIPKVYALTN